MNIKKSLGQIAFEAFQLACGESSWAPPPDHGWDSLPLVIRGFWEAAGLAVGREIAQDPTP